MDKYSLDPLGRAAQKLSSSKRKRKHIPPEPDPLPPFPTNFREIIRRYPPPAPPFLLRNSGRAVNPGAKVKVMLRICPVDGGQSPSFLKVDPTKKQVTVFDPASSGYTTAAHRRNGVSAPKMFAFDSIFCQDDSLAEMCATGLTDIIQSVVNGSDGCLFCYGHARLGKTYSMIGIDDRPQNLGVIPCAIAWLFRLINEQKEKTGARFSVRVSAVEVTGKQETLKDLLVDVAGGQEAGSGTAPGVYLREDPICGTQLENQSELRAPTAERAAFYLDAAVAARTVPEAEEDARNSHLLFTIHVYQYRLEKGATSKSVANSKFDGGRSRLHLVDLGSCGRSGDGNALTLPALGNVVLALLNGQRHVPHRDSKLTQLLRDSMGSLSCRTCMITHVSPSVQAYNATLQVIQLAAKIHRMKKRKTKFSGTSSDDSSSCDDSGRYRRYRTGIRMGTLRDGNYSSSGISSDPDISSSEQSCDTVIYTGPNGRSLSDRELTDNEGPPRMVPIPIRTVPSGSRSGASSKGSSDEGQEHFRDSRPGSPFKSGAIRKNSGSSIDHSGIPQPKSGSSMVQLPRRVNIRTRPGLDHNYKLTEPQAQEQWIDGPGAAISKQQQNDMPSAWNASAPECWVDGPGIHKGYMVKSSSPVPQEELKYIPPEHKTKSQYAPPELKTKSNSEQWVDGPTAFTQNQKSENQPMWTEMQKDKPKLCVPLKNKLITDLVEEELGIQPKSSNTSYSGSNTSLSVQPSSQPVSTNSSSESIEIAALKESNLVDKIPVKSFVKDWVEQHSVINAGVVNEDQLTIKTDLFTFLPPGDDNSNSEVSSALSPVQKSKASEPVGSTQSSPRVRRAHSHSPQPSPGSRTAQWIKSVQKDNVVPQNEKAVSQENVINDHLESEQAVISDSLNKLDEKQKDKTLNKPPEETASAPDLSELQDKPGAVDLLSVQNSLAQKSNKMSNLCEILDSSFESDTSKSALLRVSDSKEHNFEHLLNTNRESIYELTMDEQLETNSMHRGESCKVYNSSADDSFSDLSLPKDLCSDLKEELDLSCDVDDLTYETLEPGSNIIYNSSSHVPTRMDVNANPMNDPNSLQMIVNDLSVTDIPKTEPLLEKPPLAKPVNLRKPDGASNPNVHKEQEEVHYEVLEDVRPVRLCEHHKNKQSKNRTVVGQSSQESSASSGLPVSSKHVSFLANTVGKPGVPPVPPNRNAKPSPPPRISSQTMSPGNRSITGINLPQSSTRQSRASSSKNSPQTSSLSNTTTPTNVPSSKNSSAKPSSAKSSPSKLPFFSISSRSGSSPSNLASKETKKSSKEKVKKESKRSKSEGSPSISPFRRSLSKKESESKKHISFRNEESKVPVKKGSYSDDCSSPRRGVVSDSDSGNDSGISRSSRRSISKRLLSPYATVTKPRSSSHSSSGLGSDISSMCSGSPSDKWSTKKNGKKGGKSHGGTSSGYESMIRDSEGSPNDSNSESSTGGRGKSLKKKGTGSKRSRSAPARSSDDLCPSSPNSSCTQSPMSVLHKPASPKAWVDTRQRVELTDDMLKIQVYEMDDIERMQRRRKEEAELRDKIRRKRHGREEASENKGKVVVHHDSWSYDCCTVS